MTFNLTEEELENAFAAIEHHGYSALLPEPPEWALIRENWSAIRADIAEKDLDTYAPYKVTRLYAPKSRATSRLVSLLHPQDLIIYTALTIIVKDDLERARLERRRQRVYSYRAIEGDSRKLYDSTGAFATFQKQLERKSRKSGYHFVAVADIADFYPRIYQHRLENVILASAQSDRARAVARVLVKKFLSNLMKKDSYGIPVGPFASRILAEGVLIDIDAALISDGADFVRWVDDYRIFCKTEVEAQRLLYRLGELLFENHGLTLSPAKTAILPSAAFRAKFLKDDDVVVEGELDQLDRIFARRDPYEDDDFELSDEEREEVRAMNFKRLFEHSFAASELVDYSRLSSLMRHPEILNEISEGAREEIGVILLANLEHLYPVSEEAARFFGTFADVNNSLRRRISKKLLQPLLTHRNHRPPDYFVCWVLSIFASDERWGRGQDIVRIFREYHSDAVRRFAALAIAKVGTRSEAMAIKESFTSAGPLTRTAILLASRKLGADERRHWKQAAQPSGLLETLV